MKIKQLNQEIRQLRRRLRYLEKLQAAWKRDPAGFTRRYPVDQDHVLQSIRSERLRRLASVYSSPTIVWMPGQTAATFRKWGHLLNTCKGPIKGIAHK